VRVRLTQIDGKLPNLALMKLAHWHKAQNDEVFFTKNINYDGRQMEPLYRWDRVYGSAIFSFSANRVARFRDNFPDAIIGGTHNTADNRTVEEFLGLSEYEHYDYSIYDREEFVVDRGIGKVRIHKIGFDGSIGFTQRGCRLKCGFCVVPKKEGKARSINTISDIWRGEPWPKHLHLLDNDFFGQPPEQWQARLDEIRLGGFKVCLNQGINIRMVDDESARALGSIKDRLSDDTFTYRRLYTAWDNLGDEERFFRGVDLLEKYGITPSMLLVYMLVGYDKRETWERLLYRLKRMLDRRVRPYPMVFGDRKRKLDIGPLQTMQTGKYRLIANPDAAMLRERTLSDFQRWVIKRYWTTCPLDEFIPSGLPHQQAAGIAAETGSDGFRRVKTGSDEEILALMATDA